MRSCVRYHSRRPRAKWRVDERVCVCTVHALCGLCVVVLWFRVGGQQGT